MELAFILLILGAGAALKSGWDHVNSERRIDRDKRIGEREKSSGRKMTKAQRSAFARRHGAGWLAREIAGGLPVTRTGVHAGWLAHKTASMHSRHLREEARTTSDELRASFAPALAEHRKRQKAARDEIVRVCDYSAPPRDRRKAMREAADAVVLHPDFPRDDWVPDDAPGDPEDEEATSDLPEDPYPARDDARPDDSDHLRPGQKRCPQCGGSGAGPSGACSYCRGWGSDDPDPDAPQAPDGTICAACGHPGTADDPVLTEAGSTFHRSHALDAAANRATPAGDWPAGIPHRRRGGASPATEGTAMPAGTAEMTYDQTITEANGIIGDCEEEIQEARKTIAAREMELARLRARRIGAKLEMLASAGLDSGSLSRAMEIDEALKAQERAAQDAIDAAQASEKAASQALDSAQAFRDGLQRDHGGMNEAHQSAPVVGARPEFYAG